MKKRWSIAALAALPALVCWCGWYSRPVSVPALKPELEPASINVYIRRFGSTGEENESLAFDVNTSTPEGQALLGQLEAIRIRRFPLNHLREILPSTVTGRQTEPGQYNYVIHLFGADGGWVALQFFLDEWEYDLPEQPQYLPSRVSDGTQFGQALGDKLWEMAQANNHTL